MARAIREIVFDCDGKVAEAVAGYAGYEDHRAGEAGAGLSGRDGLLRVFRLHEAQGARFRAGALASEAAVFEDADGAGEFGVGVGHDADGRLGGFDPFQHGLRGFVGVAVEAELGDDGVAELGLGEVGGPAEGTDGADQDGPGLIFEFVFRPEEDVAVPASLFGALG